MHICVLQKIWLRDISYEFQFVVGLYNDPFVSLFVQRRYDGHSFEYYPGVVQEVLRRSTKYLNLCEQRFELRATRLRSRRAAQ